MLIEPSDSSSGWFFGYLFRHCPFTTESLATVVLVQRSTLYVVRGHRAYLRRQYRPARYSIGRRARSAGKLIFLSAASASGRSAISEPERRVSHRARVPAASRATLIEIGNGQFWKNPVKNPRLRCRKKTSKTAARLTCSLKLEKKTFYQTLGKKDRPLFVSIFFFENPFKEIKLQ